MPIFILKALLFANGGYLLDIQPNWKHQTKIAAYFIIINYLEVIRNVNAKTNIMQLLVPVFVFINNTITVMIDDILKICQLGTCISPAM